MTIKKRFMIAGTAFCLAIALAAVLVASHFLHEIMFQEYREKAEMMLYSMKAVRTHISRVVRPKANELLHPDDFITELQSTSFAANSVFSRISEEDRHGMRFKTASVKPRNPANKAGPVEADIIAGLDRMKQEGREPFWQGVREIDGTEHFIIAIGEVNEKDCMRCHSTPERAPVALKRLYPPETDQGYGHLEGRVESAELAAIPVEDIKAGIGRMRLSISAAALVLLAVALAGLRWGLNSVFKPVSRTSELAEQIASGDLESASRAIRECKESERRIEKAQTRGRACDEVGALLSSFRTMAGNLDSLVGQVKASGLQVSTSAAEIAASAREIEATAAEQAASLSRVNDTSTEILRTSENLSETMAAVAGDSAKTAELAQEGSLELAAMESAMQALSEATSSFSSRFASINEKAGTISSIVTTIAKVAEQTNLLSLNASIEAEKAGEFGQGFSVVAREIRRLADQTGLAAQDIEIMVREMQTAVSAGVMEMDKFADAVRRRTEEVGEIGSHMSSIIGHVQALEPRFEEAREGVLAQSRGSRRISEAMDQLSQAADQTRQTLAEFKGATEQLNEAVQDLRDEVFKFKVST